MASVYRVMLDQVVQEIDDPDFAATGSSWRRMVLEAIAGQDDVEDLPHLDSDDKSKWDDVIECLEAAVLWDNDYELRAGLDADPDTSSAAKHVLGIDDNYFTAVPLDVPDDQLDLYIDAPRGLTPRETGQRVGQGCISRDRNRSGGRIALLAISALPSPLLDHRTSFGSSQ